MANKTYTVTVASGNLYGGGTGNVFYLDGARNATGPGTIEWVSGSTLRFDQSAGTNDNHPLVFSTNTNTSGIISSGVTYYLDGASNQANYTNTTTFNAATVRYVEITPSSQTDFYYLCYVHGIGMGGIFDITQNTWGALPWGHNSWQSLTSTIIPTGFSLPMVLGDEASTPSTGWSSQSWSDNAWGSHISTIKPSGQPMTANQGSVTPFGSAGWGGLAWNVGEWGSVNTGNQLVTGLALSANLGSVEQTSSTGWGRNSWGSAIWNGFGDTLPTGVAMSMALDGNVLINTEINAGWGRLGWNVNAWGVRGQVGATGQAMTMSLANVGIDNEINTGWGSDGWGVEGWGSSIQVVQPTGQALTLAEGSGGITFDGDSNLTLTGNPLTIAQGDESVNIKVGPIVTGFPLGISLTFDSAVINATGFAMSASLGTAVGDNITFAEVSAKSASTWGNSNWGFGVYGNQQITTLAMAMSENFSGVDPAPDAEVTGQSMAMNLAVPGQNNFNIIGDANIAPLAAMGWSDGTWGESKWGNGLYRPDTDDIFPLTMSLGTATLDAVTTPTITGLTNLFTAVGSVTEITGDAQVFPTGFGLTFSLGTATNVLIWDEVNTGTAPVDPPGWQEVSTNAA